MHCSTGGDVSFVLRSLEEEEGEDSDGCCVLNVQKSVCQGVSVLVMGSSSGLDSCDDAHLSGWTWNVLSSAWSARLTSGRNRLGKNWGLTPCSFLAVNIELGA